MGIFNTSQITSNNQLTTTKRLPLPKCINILIVSVLLMVIDGVSMKDQQTSPLPSHWHPVYKPRNVTKDWKLSSNDLDTKILQDSAMTGSAQSPQYISLTTQPSSQYSYYHNQHYDTSHIHEVPQAQSRVEHVSDAADLGGYYYPSFPPGGYPGIGGYPGPGPGGYPGPPPLPTYGPPPEEGPGAVIELSPDRLVVQCTVQEPLEHITWTRYSCPEDYAFGNGVPVADGSIVHNSDIYSLQISGENGEISSRLLIRSPLEPDSSGLYLCEAWPHYQKPSDTYGPPSYQQPMPTYSAKSDAFIIGGGDLIEQCYNNRPPPPIMRPLKFNKNRLQNIDKSNIKKTTQQSSTSTKKVNQNASDALRKPRNITKAYNEFENNDQIINANNQKLTLVKKQRDELRQQRYNFIFDNQTKIHNASLSEIFKHKNLEQNNRFQKATRNDIKKSINTVRSITPLNYHRPREINLNNNTWPWKYMNGNNSTQIKPSIATSDNHEIVRNNQTLLKTYSRTNK